MTDYNAIPDEDLEPGKPWTSIKALRTRDNPIAIAEGAAGAPRIQNAAMANGSVDNANVVNGTLGAEKFQAGAAERDWVLARTSGASLDALGTYAFCRNDSGFTLDPGDTVSGGDIIHASSNNTTSLTLPGTWRCMGYAPIGESTLFLRIS